MAIPLRHRRNQKRRLFAGAVERSYLRELRAMRVQEGRPVRRRLFAGQVGIAYRREQRVQRLAQGKGTPRHALSRHLKGEFSGYVRDPTIRRTPRRSRRK